MDDPIIKVSALLEKIDIPYCLIGGYAAAYGAPRYTANKKPARGQAFARDISQG